MKALVFNSCGFRFPQTNVMAEEIMELQSQTSDIVAVTCGGCLKSCFCNPEGYSVICAYCKACQRNIYGQIGCGFRPAAIGRLDEKAKHDFKFKTIAEIKSITYRDVYVGYGVLSDYASTTRSGNYVFETPVIEYLKGKLDETCAYVDKVTELFDRERPDVVSIFNGRFMEERAFFDIAKARNIPVRVNEVVPDEPGVKGWRKIVFDGCLPHDIDANTKMINDLWNASPVPESERWKIGADFFERRAVGKGANSVDIVFTQDQQIGLLPEHFDRRAKNIVVFNSSEDEFVAIGREFDRHDIFPDQLSGIETILEALKDTDYNVIVRIHPNLSGINDSFVNRLYDLPRKYRNATIIPPESRISSYTLLENAEKVVTFGSTMGIEAVYWGKPSVLLRAAYYKNLDGCYKPRNKDEAIALLTQTLAPGSKEGAIRYGFWLMNRHLTGYKIEHFPDRLLSFKPKFLFGNYSTPHNLAVGGGPAIATLIARFLVRMPWIISRRRVKCPKKIYCSFRTIVKR